MPTITMPAFIYWQIDGSALGSDFQAFLDSYGVRISSPRYVYLCMPVRGLGVVAGQPWTGQPWTSNLTTGLAAELIAWPIDEDDDQKYRSNFRWPFWVDAPMSVTLAAGAGPDREYCREYWGFEFRPGEHFQTVKMQRKEVRSNPQGDQNEHRQAWEETGQADIGDR